MLGSPWETMVKSNLLAYLNSEEKGRKQKANMESEKSPSFLNKATWVQAALGLVASWLKSKFQTRSDLSPQWLAVLRVLR